MPSYWAHTLLTHCQSYLFLLSCKPIIVEEIKLPITIGVHYINALHYIVLQTSNTIPNDAHPTLKYISISSSMLAGPHNSAGHVMDFDLHNLIKLGVAMDD